MSITSYILHFTDKDEDLFVQAKNCLRKIEVRAATYKYKGIKSGDIIVFKCQGKYFVKKVKKAGKFKSLAALLKKYDIEDIMPDAKSLKDVEKRFHSFPGYRERIKKYGLIAIELC